MTKITSEREITSERQHECEGEHERERERRRERVRGRQERQPVRGRLNEKATRCMAETTSACAGERENKCV